MNTNFLELLDILPNSPASLTTKQVHERWGGKRDKRTIQRSLNELKYQGFVTYRSEGRTRHWSRLNDAKSVGSGMSRQNAFAIKTSEPFLQEIIPNSLKQQFTQLFDQAANVLSSDHDKTPWQKKFILEAPTFPPSHEAIDSAVKEEILKAVLEEESIQILYQRPDRTPNWRVVFPYGVILSKNTQYLIGAGLKPFEDGGAYWGNETANSDNIRAYALHRITEVKPSTKEFQKVPEFDLRAFAESGVTNYKIDFQDIRVHLVAKDATAKILRNAQLEDLDINELGNEQTEFTFTTPFTYQFIRWCIAHGHHLHIKGPDILLEKIGQQIRDPRLPF